MALTKSVTHLGTTYPNAYYKLESFDISFGRETDGVKYYISNLQVKCYTDSTKEYVLDEGVGLGRMRQDFVEADNTFPKHYEWLKTLPEFEGAVDA